MDLHRVGCMRLVCGSLGPVVACGCSIVLLWLDLRRVGPGRERPALGTPDPRADVFRRFGGLVGTLLLLPSRNELRPNIALLGCSNVIVVVRGLCGDEGADCCSFFNLGDCW